ncbi:uncharacterized protein PITG_05010 [Phytophthora infestans T30-4]|uniref:Chorismate lyase n=2 Tax=Phytophthora infestans TaxID=4787 RepID=D0N2K5_PHYIT|nr:uncharacterized protein PITG_05010 [Phytophthora infestans T30-4]EEY68534.1 conserved hypothetical protein [Phytophthora infestans T30-4]|eukprot:XP_002905693.1 conserved hypothetical protein [Phytophthora infestans T30-4]
MAIETLGAPMLSQDSCPSAAWHCRPVFDPIEITGAPHIKAATMVTDGKTAAKEIASTLVSSATAATENGKKGRDWYKLKVTFLASPEAMQLGHAEMSAAWRLFLFGNGSPTHHLGLLTGSPTEVDVLGMLPVENSADNAPTEIEAIAAPRCRRQVFLRNARGERLGYAASWINVEDVGAVFKDTKIPIGKNILQHKTELYRDMKSVFCGHSAVLEKAFGAAGPFWGRSYLFWNGGRPVTFIYEVFSPALEKYMGKVLL